MRYLFDSQGRHIANEVSGGLHLPTGENIGHFVKSAGMFVDMGGRYLGEIIQSDRLMFNRSSPHRSVNYGAYGNAGNAGNYGNPGNPGSVGLMAGYEDIPEVRLR
jgi:hypothetical protein